MTIRTLIHYAVLAYGVALLATGPARAAGNGGDFDASRLQEIIVTAEKRSERLQDVPVPVTSISAETLLDNGQLRLEDYYTSIPSLSLTPNSQGGQTLAIRGITTGGQTNPTVGVTIDDAPFGSTIGLGNLDAVPDLDPSELARVEVLRGPQGTLYGASSIGGLVKFVTMDPSTAGVTGRVQADLGGVSHGQGLGYGVRGSVNVPLSDSLAIRASGFTRRDPGYIDDPVFHRRGVNQVDVKGGHFSALWRPSEIWSVKLSALLQSTSAGGQSFSTPGAGFGDLAQIQGLPFGQFHHDVQAYSATVTGVFGGVTLNSISGYGIDMYHAAQDASQGFSYFQSFGVSGVEDYENRRDNKFTQEFRLTGSLWQRLDWLAGAFYTHEDIPTRDLYYAVDPSTLSVAGLVLDDPYPSTYAEYAEFVDLTYHFTDKFDVQVGGRESQNKQAYSETLTGPGDSVLGLISPAIQPAVHTKDNAFTYLLTPRYKITPNDMIYARMASGYRPGGPNTTCLIFVAPCKYSPDKTINYEVGFKGDALDRRLSFDASLFYIDWKDIQLQVNDLGSGALYFVNASRAKSQGLEVSAQARPLDGLTIAAWVAWTDAKLKTGLPLHSAAYGLAGDRLPYSSHFSGNLSLDEEVNLASGWIAFIGGTISRVGDREDNFTPTVAQARNLFPGYTQTNIRVGARYDSWRVALFAKNVADSRSILSSGGVAGPKFPNVVYSQPRAIGLSITRTF